MKQAVYPGSFDPVTVGHLDIITRASKIFDEVIVLIMRNVEKKGFFNYEQRREFLELAVSDLENVKVDVSDGLLTEYLEANGISTIVKGLRSSKDFQYELDMAYINRFLDHNIDTVFLISEPEYIMISSSAVRELLSYSADIAGFVPEIIRDKILEYAEGFNNESK